MIKIKFLAYNLSLKCINTTFLFQIKLGVNINDAFKIGSLFCMVCRVVECNFQSKGTDKIH